MYNDSMPCRILLPALYNIAGSDVGLVEALASGAVEVKLSKFPKYSTQTH